MKGYSQSSLGSVSVPANLRQMYERVSIINYYPSTQIRIANIIAAITPSCQSLRTNWFSQNRFDQQIIIATSRSGMKQTMWCHQLKMVGRPNFPTGYYNLKISSTRSIFCHHQRGDHTKPNLGRMSWGSRQHHHNTFNLIWNIWSK